MLHLNLIFCPGIICNCTCVLPPPPPCYVMFDFLMLRLMILREESVQDAYLCVCACMCVMSICFPPHRIPEIMNFANFTHTSCLKISLNPYCILELCKCIMHQLSSINLLLADTSSMNVIACIILICQDR